MIEHTLSIIKPDAVAAHAIGGILGHIEKAGLHIVAARMRRLALAEAEAFYAVHRSRPFFADLTRYMASGPVLVSVLAGEGAIARYRDLMGATDPAKAAAGTLRKLFGRGIEQNAVHGSDAADTAAREVAFFFAGMDLHAA